MQPTNPPSAPIPSGPTPSFIPPVTNRKNIGAFSNKLLLIIIGSALAVLIGIGLMFASRANDPSDDIVKLQGMMQTLTNIIAEGRKSARAPELVKATSDASILLSGDTANLKTTLSTLSVKPNKDITAAEKAASATLVAELKSAAVDARFDREYQRILSEQLTTTRDQMLKVYNKSSRPALRASLKTIDEHFVTMLEALQKITL